MPKFLSDITETDLEEIKKMAAVFFTPKEIALVLEVDAASFIEACDCEGNVIYNDFAGGRLQSEFEVKQSVVKLAKQGSSPAQAMAMDMIKISQLKMLNK